MGEILNGRRSETKARFQQLRESLAEAEKAAGEKACVYATGSFGREETSKHSDLDLFIVGRGAKYPRELSPLTEICIKADLIEATKKFGIPEFDGDGQYLAHHSEEELIDNLGTRADDAENTFTARLLLLLESKPLLGLPTYQRIIDNVIAKYWRDYETHKSDFIPAFLANDILRLWRTFCVNYEAGTRTEPPREHAKRRLKNYKLKHSRLLTCYSGLLYLLGLYVEKKTVSPDNAVEMVRLTPTGRLEQLLLNERFQAGHETMKKLLAHYEGFLEATAFSKDELIERFLDAAKRKEYSVSESELGKLVFSAIELIGENSTFHRVLVV
jgi:predicted nucleotidyltransferase